MLVLTRRPGEMLHIGPNITVTVVEVRGNRIRLGIQAPEDVAVLRAELNKSSASAFAAIDAPSRSEAAGRVEAACAPTA